MLAEVEIDWPYNLRIMAYGIFFVLLALVLLAIAIWLMGVYFQRQEKRGDKDIRKESSEGIEKGVKDEKIKVAIMAAVAAYMTKSVPRPKVKRFKKEEQSRWETMGRYELMEEP